jgi:uncharacterized protein YndB with AHSA1/START domain
MDADVAQLKARVSMLINRPADEVFDAFTDPETITRFWLRSSSGPLAPGATVRWTFQVPGAEADTEVIHFERGRALAIAWSDGTTVSWHLGQHESGGTVVVIENFGFAGSSAEILEAALESTQGFTIVLCDLKVLLEGGVPAHLSRDKAILIQSGQA